MGSKLWRWRPGRRGASGSASSTNLPVPDDGQNPVVLVRPGGIYPACLAADQVVQIVPRLLTEWLTEPALLALWESDEKDELHDSPASAPCSASGGRREMGGPVRAADLEKIHCLIIVARDQPDLWFAIQRQFAAYRRVQIIQDRRRWERRQRFHLYEPERRRVDRRRPLCIKNDLYWRPYLIVRLQQDTIKGQRPTR